MTVRRVRQRTAATWRDLSYASTHARQVLDIYYPTSGVRPAGGWPVMVYIHEGLWSSGSKTLATGEAPLDCLANGIALVSVDYRLSGDAAWPAHIQDCKAAIRWLRANAHRFQLNTGRLGVWGSSAGAHIAAILALTPGVAALRDAALGNSSYSEAVACCVSWFAPTELQSEDADFTTQVAAAGAASTRGHLICSTSSAEAQLLGGTATPVEPCTASAAVQDAASVVYWCANGTALPPMRIQHGASDDSTVPVNQARRFKTALESRSITFAGGTTYHYGEETGAPHGVAAAAWKTAPIKTAVMTWLASQLGTGALAPAYELPTVLLPDFAAFSGETDEISGTPFTHPALSGYA